MVRLSGYGQAEVSVLHDRETSQCVDIGRGDDPHGRRRVGRTGTAHTASAVGASAAESLHLNGGGLGHY